MDDGWGFSVIVLFLVIGSSYTGGGIAWNAKVHGKRGWDALPHQVRLPRIPKRHDLGNKCFLKHRDDDISLSSL